MMKSRFIWQSQRKRTGHLEELNPGGVEQSILRKISELGGEFGLLYLGFRQSMYLDLLYAKYALGKNNN